MPAKRVQHNPEGFAMKSVLALGFALLASAPAFAGSITFQIAETAQATLTKSYAVPDAQIDRIVAALQVAANAAVNGNATRAQVLQFWVTQVVTKLVSDVAATENAAAVSAVPLPPPINPQ